MRRIVGLLALILLAPLTAQGSPILINGSFELGPSFSFQDIDIASGSTAITGWTAIGTSSAGAIDYLGPPWDVSDGLHAVDLDGRDSLSGGIYQTFVSTIGRTYVVSFDLSGNPHGPPQVKQVHVAVDGVSQDYSHDSLGQATSALIWQSLGFSFIASGPTATLSFTSLTPNANSYGPLIDNVNVQEAPEASTLLLLGTSFAAIAHRQRKRKRPVAERA